MGHTTPPLVRGALLGYRVGSAHSSARCLSKRDTVIFAERIGSYLPLSKGMTINGSLLTGLTAHWNPIILPTRENWLLTSLQQRLARPEEGCLSMRDTTGCCWRKDT